jgi:hypothetical protein
VADGVEVNSSYATGGYAKVSQISEIISLFWAFCDGLFEDSNGLYWQLVRSSKISRQFVNIVLRWPFWAALVKESTNATQRGNGTSVLNSSDFDQLIFNVCRDCHDCHDCTFDERIDWGVPHTIVSLGQHGRRIGGTLTAAGCGLAPQRRLTEGGER